VSTVIPTIPTDSLDDAIQRQKEFLNR